MTSGNPRADFRAAIEEALALLETPATRPSPGAGALALSLPSLLEQCREMLHEASAQENPPIRCLHHLACSGGTLIARSVAALPNTRVLSEVDPLSELAHLHNRFVPSDLIGLARLGARPPGQPVLVEIFRAGLEVLHRDSVRHGLHLVLRDHAHSLFCHGPQLADRPTLREMLAGHHALRGVVTVRHPLDCYLALQANEWMHFAPPSLEEYARRHTAFLERHADLTVVRYEDFLAEPEAAMQTLCTALDLRMETGFRQRTALFALSGDSGRRGRGMALRPRREVGPGLRDEAAQSTAYIRLCARLGYDPEPG